MTDTSGPTPDLEPVPSLVADPTAAEPTAADPQAATDPSGPVVDPSGLPPGLYPPPPGYRWVYPVQPQPPGPFRRFWSGYREPLPGRAVGGALVAAALGATVGLVRPGLGVVLLCVVAWLAAVPVLVKTRRWADLLLAVASVATVSVLAWRASPVVTVPAVLVAVLAGTVAAVGARTVLSVGLAPLTTLATAVRTVPWFVVGATHNTAGRRRAVGGVVAATGVAVVLLAVLASLFAAADPVFAQVFPRISLPSVPGRVVAALFWFGVAVTVVHAVTTPPPGATRRLGQARAARLTEWLIPVLTVVGIVVVFGVFQLVGLAGGTGALLDRTGLTYAEHARQGFGQLLVATVLTVAVVAVAVRRAPRSTRSERTWTTASVVALCLGALGVVAVALHRLDSYVTEFGLSRSRVLAGWTALVLAALLVLGLVAVVRWRTGWLVRGVVGVLVVAVLALAAWNPEARIVTSNAQVDHPIDVPYLSRLSADAVPAVARLPEPERTRLLRRYHETTSPDWTSWNWSRDRAATALRNH
ncbi:MAG: DUF4173 domain-containing protein [Micrococcales bacterium]|nr:DUF4173 domain-containing protein [Micrococcales bacterium]